METADPVPASDASRPWLARPVAALGGVVAGQLLLARSDQAAVILTSVLAYPTGFEFDISAILRAPEPATATDLARPPAGASGPPRPRTPVDGVGGLQVMVRFADGTVLSSLHRSTSRADREPAGPLLSPVAASTDQQRHDARFWVWPLPPDGPVTVECAWPARDIPHSRVEVSGELIRQAAAGAVELWPAAPPADPAVSAG
ncbi:hypothetical protein O7621_14300 [Solwaraspora sp. WMMD937]|uniref:hypothetical protein n=1 Tax=Solwaraspora sp. WMMD937 TaxID=3016090 RepID=UPI00249B575A|nr:hypothetical protein [Solwaraspora sp. WMMD937]WFE24333.1 hypothetical protein O7621_14300 [Solwaraspora sp. WMMD937]